MYASTFVSVFAFVASVAAAPWSDPTVCAPGKGYYQVCASSGFKGCCTQDACGLGYCPDAPSGPVTPPPTNTHNTEPAPGTCAAGLSYYVCSNGFKGCCSQDACTIGYCPPTWEEKPVDHHEHEEPAALPGVPSPEAGHPGTCPTGMGYYQVCANGYNGCCTKDACSLGYCPDNGAFQKVKRAADPTVCAPGTGYYQVCSNGFKGCCSADACGLGYCPGTAAPWTPEPVPVQPPTNTYPVASPQNGVCPAGTGYYQVCASGFKGCCAKDACSLGYCPY